MPIHDWTRVSAGTFHDFHAAWITELRNALNGGVLPDDYYAQAEQIAGQVLPDVLTLKVEEPQDGDSGSANGGVALAVAPPKVRITAQSELDIYARKQNTLVIRHASDDRVVALLEIISSGNKAKKSSFRALLDKAQAALAQDINLLLLDLYPPTKRDPQGLHGALWGEIEDEDYQALPDKPLTLAGYAAGHPIRAFVEPVAVGDSLPDMPLFLDPEHYVPAPLEATYQAAWRGVPRRWQKVLDA